MFRFVISGNIRKAVSLENMRNFFVVSVSWSIRNFLEVDFFIFWAWTEKCRFKFLFFFYFFFIFFFFFTFVFYGREGGVGKEEALGLESAGFNFRKYKTFLIADSESSISQNKKLFLILELKSSISQNIRDFFGGVVPGSP